MWSSQACVPRGVRVERRFARKRSSGPPSRRRPASPLQIEVNSDRGDSLKIQGTMQSRTDLPGLRMMGTAHHRLNESRTGATTAGSQPPGMRLGEQAREEDAQTAQWSPLSHCAAAGCFVVNGRAGCFSLGRRLGDPGVAALWSTGQCVWDRQGQDGRKPGVHPIIIWLGYVSSVRFYTWPHLCVEWPRYLGR